MSTLEQHATIAGLRASLAAHRKAGRRIALVPTMGFLHEGHLALVDAAHSQADIVVMSIFVNPRQFQPGEDFERYPRDLAHDRALAEARHVDILFAPEVGEMYGSGDELRIVAGETAARWEGEFRPGHFDGVLTVVAKLFNIVQPDVACFGQKDIQQVTLIRRMIQELDIPVRLHISPTVRESDGLARSSRNVYLTPAQRLQALALSRGLRAAEAAFEQGETDAAALERVVRRVLETEPEITTDYIAVVEPRRLAPVSTVDAGTIIALAARVGSTRLIDNVILGDEDV
ncbi:MAG: pantoate--beta-alanine ligase [Gemmatimonadales bacterium]